MTESGQGDLYSCSFFYDDITWGSPCLGLKERKDKRRVRASFIIRSIAVWYCYFTLVFCGSPVWFNPFPATINQRLNVRFYHHKVWNLMIRIGSNSCLYPIMVYIHFEAIISKQLLSKLVSSSNRKIKFFNCVLVVGHKKTIIVFI